VAIIKYADFDKRKLILPDLLDQPLAYTTKDGKMRMSADQAIPSECYVFFYPIKEWLEIKEIRGEK